MPVAPVLSQEQRRAAYDLALELRRQRAELKRWVSGEGPGPEWATFRLMDAFTEERAQGMKVIDLLTSLPGVGRARALALLEAAGMDDRKTVRGCGLRQREKLFGALGIQTDEGPRQ